MRRGNPSPLASALSGEMPRPDREGPKEDSEARVLWGFGVLKGYSLVGVAEPRFRLIQGSRYLILLLLFMLLPLPQLPLVLVVGCGDGDGGGDGSGGGRRWWCWS